MGIEIPRVHIAVWTKYETGIHVQFHGYIDVDWVGSISDMRSTSGFMFFIGSTTVSWSNNKK